MALAMQDPLTQLFNRRALVEALTAATKTPPANGTEHALYLMDLNGFKRINDKHGHAVGDHVLEVLAERFRAAARPSDLVARIGGDEFAVLAYNVDQTVARQIGMRFVECLASPVRAGEHTHQISMAIGVALIPEHGDTVEDALRNADIAMYRAKELGKDMLFFEPESAARKRIA